MLLSAIPWLLLAEALLSMVVGPNRIALALRLVSGAVLWWLLPGHLPVVPELVLNWSILEVLAWALATCLAAAFSLEAAAIPGTALMLGLVSLAWLQDPS